MIANMDRRVRVLEPSNERGRHCRLSELEATIFVVLLGEPGIGKSTVLSQAAARAGMPLVTVRKLLSSASLPPDPILFIDALDQVRTRDGSVDKIDALAIVLRDSSATQWRLACRSEDWRGKGDLEALLDSSSPDDVFVVQLLPLQYDEKVLVS